MSMELKEAGTRFEESLKRAASCARELCLMQEFDLWKQIAKSIDGIRIKGVHMANSKAVAKADVDRQINSYQKATARKNGETVQ